MKTRHPIVILGLTSLIGVLPATAAHGDTPVRARGAGELRDLQVTTEQPTDHATAQVVAIESNGSTIVRLKVQGLAHFAAGTELGAHIHVGSCEKGNGAAARRHYNSSTTNPLTVTSSTEVWLDFEIGSNGTASAEAHVPFVIPPGGAGALVIHAAGTSTGPTPPAGSAGARWACLPVEF